MHNKMGLGINQANGNVKIARSHFVKPGCQTKATFGGVVFTARGGVINHFNKNDHLLMAFVNIVT